MAWIPCWRDRGSNSPVTADSLMNFSFGDFNRSHAAVGIIPFVSWVLMTGQLIH